ncbi:glycosyltransferase [Stieleria sp. JC731]|uniref:glycosyltransferase n=1 Tax=Pirellulaceae TaxID=2691357 RepID=UPI001E2BBCBC|nr:glycosyltransferase [Stieleria sp. JC731]MCC9599039.1 glycosyltransferase [Stieleria sp. JC731]
MAIVDMVKILRSISFIGVISGLQPLRKAEPLLALQNRSIRTTKFPGMMTTTRPAVSVLMPIWNANETYLTEAVKSLQGQSLQSWELVVVEDPSESMSDAVLGAIGDPRIRYHHNSTRTSLVQQLNLGLSLCQSDFIARFDADDRCKPERLQKQLAFLEGRPEYGVCGCQLEIINQSGKATAKRFYPVESDSIGQMMMIRNVIPHPGAMFRKSLVESLGGYREDHPYAEDYDLWCRMLKQGAKLHNDATQLLEYRIHDGQIKSQKLRSQIAGTIAVKKEHWRDEMALSAKFRMCAEQALLAIPPKLVSKVFQLLYHQS